MRTSTCINTKHSRYREILFLLFFLAAGTTCFGWGFFGHRTIAQLSVYTLPASMQTFYFHHMKLLVRLSTAPDERRDVDPKEASKHYIDMDHFGDNPFGAMPKAWEKAEAKFTADSTSDAVRAIVRSLLGEAVERHASQG